MTTNYVDLQKWEVRSNTSDYNLARICDEINLGDENKGGINLKPFYQREYKFTKKDESLLIESLLGGIPIPIIYLASDTSKVPHVSNVIDGQHRLFAVYRYMTNKFPLTGLTKYSELNGYYFDKLHPTIQNKLKHQISLTLQFIHVQNDPQLELEIFTRYNQGTHPLTKQEIRTVVFSSIFNDWLMEKITSLKNSIIAKEIFNITDNRYANKRIHEEIYVLFGIYKNLIKPNYSLSKDIEKKYNISYGINQDYYSSPEYVNEFMDFARKNDELDNKLLIDECDNFFTKFYSFLQKVYYNTNIKYPLSREIYETVKIRNHKMQTSIMMILVPVAYELINRNIDFDNNKNQTKIKKAIKEGFLESNFPNITSSTTRPALVTETISKIFEKIKFYF